MIGHGGLLRAFTFARPIKVLLIVYMSTLTYWSFYFLIFLYVFLCGATRLYVSVVIIPRF